MHRAHHDAFWKTHAVHHSSRELGWLASVRGHPVNVVMQRAPIAIGAVLLGFDLTALAGGTGAFALYGLLLHARVDWDFVPLRRVLASPRFRRWHHSRDVECNFAGLLPL
ncbi:MAG: sterol desaturase family protein [Proteobacteria bacterium]|nr:sterol desaturase family protein [Pseudomonadota bacterium]MCP4918714.1 sterol desaturase family protein [Pseudomonadota bacterium]